MRPGYKTTEFWLGLVTVILTYLNTKLGLHIPVAEIVALIGMVISYILGRTWLKSRTSVPTITVSTTPITQVTP